MVFESRVVNLRGGWFACGLIVGLEARERAPWQRGGRGRRSRPPATPNLIQAPLSTVQEFASTVSAAPR